MEWLNYHHLLYFWTVVRLGGLAPAAEELRLAPSTISAQIRRLEESLSERLFRKSGRRLALTDMGRLVFGYADEIFSTGREMLKAVQGLPTGRPMRLVVGIADVVPKLVAQRLIEPALRLPEPAQVVCREASPEQLVDGLARHVFDLLITDAPLGAEVKIRAHSHLLGESGVTFVAESNAGAPGARAFPRLSRRAADAAAHRRTWRSGAGSTSGSTRTACVRGSWASSRTASCCASSGRRVSASSWCRRWWSSRSSVSTG